MTDRAGDCRQLLEQLSRYIDGELHDVDRRAVTLHLKRCPCCEELVGALRRTALVCREAGHRRLPADVRARARARVAALLSRPPALNRVGRK